MALDISAYVVGLAPGCKYEKPGGYLVIIPIVIVGIMYLASGYRNVLFK